MRPARLERPTASARYAGLDCADADAPTGGSEAFVARSFSLAFDPPEGLSQMSGAIRPVSGHGRSAEEEVGFGGIAMRPMAGAVGQRLKRGGAVSGRDADRRTPHNESRIGGVLPMGAFAKGAKADAVPPQQRPQGLGAYAKGSRDVARSQRRYGREDFRDFARRPTPPPFRNTGRERLRHARKRNRRIGA